MAKDPLFEDDKPDADKKPDGTPAADTPATQAQLDALTAQLDTSLGKFGTQVTAAIEQMAAKANQKPVEEVTPLEANELAQQLLADPAKVLDEHSTANMRKVLAPFLSTLVEDNYDDRVVRHRAEFDAQYGTGTFDEHINPELDGIFAKLPTETKGSAKNLQEVINGIKGRKIDVLIEAKSKAEKAKTEAAETQAQAPQMLGVGLAAPTPGTLTDDDKEFIAKYEVSMGTELDTKHLMKVRDAIDPDGTLTYSAWKKTQPETKEAPK